MYMKIALYGGSFDPPHLGHLLLARQVVETFAADKFYFMPAYHSPLKNGRPAATDAQRLEMLRLAIADDPDLNVSDFELAKGGISYTVDTLREWRKMYPKAEILFIAGMDSLKTLHSWKEPLEIVRLCRFITFKRPQCELPTLESLGLPSATAKQLLADVFDGRLIDISSSEIRDRVAKGSSISYLVPKSVEAYIRQNRIYACA